MAETPELRASDADREQTAELLRRAVDEGRLTVDELDDRLAEAFAARTRAELEALVADVVLSGDAALGVPVGAAAASLPVVPGEGATKWLRSGGSTAAPERYRTRLGLLAEASMSRGAAEPSAGTSITSSPTP